MVAHTDDKDASASLKFHPGVVGDALKYVPLFFFVLILYIFGKAGIADPRAPIVGVGSYVWSWVEVLLVTAAVLAMLEQLKVSHPGIDNTIEALLMVAMGVVQLILFVLGAAKVSAFAMFDGPEFLILTVISLAASVVAIMINARTLRRTIGVGDN